MNTTFEPLLTKDAEGREIEVTFRHRVDFDEALSSGKYWRKNQQQGERPKLLDLATMSLERLQEMAQALGVIAWKTMDKPALKAALEPLVNPKPPKPGKEK